MNGTAAPLECLPYRDNCCTYIVLYCGYMSYVAMLYVAIHMLTCRNLTHAGTTLVICCVQTLTAW